MPLRCRNPITGQDIHAFDLSADQWRTLMEENRHAYHLRLPCCPANVVLKRSKLGTQFFAHKPGANCTNAPETEMHLRLKQIAVEAARANGWEAMTEVRGTTPDGEQWIADVLALKGSVKVAVEIQWSGQTDDETRARQARYAKSGVRGLWLLRQSGFYIGNELPAARVAAGSGENYHAVLPDRWSGRWSSGQEISAAELLDAAFSGRLRFGLPQGFAMRVSVWANDAECWSCRRDFRLITRIEVEYGPYSCCLTIPNLADHRGVFEIVRAQLPAAFKGTAIKDRYSQTQERSYLSNGCVHCDKLCGEFYEFEHREGETKAGEFVTTADAAWCHAITEQHEPVEGIKRWGVYQRL